MDAPGSNWHTETMPWWDIAVGVVLLILGFLVWLLAAPRTTAPPARGQRTMDDVQRLVREGHTIAAIKIYRGIHGVGLKEAKEAVDAMRP